MNSIRSAPELYAHAMAIEQEAAERYAELAERMSDQGNEAVAEIFGRLAQMEAEHLEALRLRTQDVALPQLAAGQYNWLQEGLPETAARELIFRLMTPRRALAIALAAENRAQAFFEQAFMTADDPALRAWAREVMSKKVISIDEHDRISREKAQKILDRLAERAREAGVESDSDYAQSDHPFQAIIRAAEQHCCDLILMASHGRHGLAALVYGSE